MKLQTTKSVHQTFDRFHPENITPKKNNFIWVFASDSAGRHTVGNAKIAHQAFEAKYAVANGMTGKAYAITCYNKKNEPMPFEDVKQNILSFLNFAKSHPKVHFYITEFSGFNTQDVAVLFKDASENCCVPESWKPTLLALFLCKN